MKVLHILAISASPLLADISLDPTFHFNGVIGDTSADSLSEIGGHAHDPNDNFAVQGLEPGLNLRVDDWLASFTNINVFTDSNHEIDWELEEAFLKFKNLPGGFELRGGRMLARMGLQNNQHLHAWTLVNSNLTTSQFLGEEGLMSEGTELTWRKDFDRGFFAISSNFSNTASHHHHGDDDDFEGEEDNGDEEGHREDEHGHSSEDAFMEDRVFVTRALLSYNWNDFHQNRLGINTAWGENGYGRDTSMHSIDYIYTWRENGIELGGREFSIGAEYFYRDVEWMGENDPTLQGATSQNNLMAYINYRFHPQWIAGLRYEYLEGARGGAYIHLGETEYAFESAERKRLTLALTREFRHSDIMLSTIRLQYSHDDLEDEDADSIWLQFGFDFGGPEIR
ncbi:hypothetical protein N9270_00730 [Akkermansiaceae bacterium]|nr:hypothetical protein [Akkermansiaceae bacterium]